MNGGAIIYHAAPQYIAILSFSISIFIIPCILYLIYKSIKSDRRALLALTWFACNFLPWIAISLFFNRTTYIYYMYPVIIAFSIGISQGLGELSDYWNKNRPDKIASLKRLSIPVYLVLHVIVFAALSPLAPPLINWIVR
jgi:dolichyl-phosphate-mannose--protein O-mannosyl transferase